MHRSATQRSKVSNVTQKPLELILARNLMSALSTPAFLVDEGGVLVFYNEAAGMLLGKRFEELGTVGADEWGALFGPFDDERRADPLRRAAAGHGGPQRPPGARRADDPLRRRRQHQVEASAFPILTAHGSQGAIAILWPTATSRQRGGPA